MSIAVWWIEKKISFNNWRIRTTEKAITDLENNKNFVDHEKLNGRWIGCARNPKNNQLIVFLGPVTIIF